MSNFLNTAGIVVLFISLIPITNSCKKDKVTPPMLTTAGPTEITQKTVTSGGNITSDGGEDIIIAGICWSTSAGASVKDKHTSDAKEIGSFTSNLTGLTPGARYYLKAYAYTKAGIGYGNEVTFSTLPIVGATLTTADVTSITPGTAISGGNITADGGGNISERGVCWGISASPTIEGSHISSGTGTGIFISNITDLTPNTKYYIRAYATNSAGTTYGNELTFTTLGQAPTAVTQAACCLSSTGAKLNGSVNPNYLSTIVTFEYGLTTAYENSVTATPSPVTGNNSTNVSAYISGLNIGMTYHFRIKAVNSLGTTYGDDMLFTTPIPPPPTN